MFPFKHIGDDSHELLAGEDTHNEQLTEVDQTQCCFQNGNQMMTFQESGELKSESLWVHSSTAPCNAFENTSNLLNQEQALCNSNPLISEVIWPHENYFDINSVPVCNSTQLPQLPYLQHVLPLHPTPKPNQRCSMSRNHKAQITLVPTSTGKFKAIVKRKRKRTIFTTEQIEALEQYFSKKPYVTREDRQVLVNQLHLNDKAVKVWFQNRRLKEKRTNEQPGHEQMERSLPDSRLDYVQAQIDQKTDEFGFVTLDDALMGNLVNVIDSIMSNNYNSESSSEGSPTTISSPIYEPISPADSTTEEDSAAQWDRFEPKECLRNLFNLHTVSPM